MPDENPSVHITKLREFVAREHFRYNRFYTAAPDKNEFELQNGIVAFIDAPRTPLIDQMASDFISFCWKCLKVKVVISYEKPSLCGLHFILQNDSSSEYNVMDPANETFTMTVSSDGVSITAQNEHGLMQASHYLEHIMADRGAPYLPFTEITRTPRFTPRCTNGIAVEPKQRNSYLSMLSHFGANAVHMGVELSKCNRNSIIPELSSPDFEKNIEKLNTEIELLYKHGMSLFLCVHSFPLAADHPAFLADPARRGAPYRVFDDMQAQYVLCSSNPEVLAYYEESIECLFNALPKAAGAMLLIGGEGFMHCYSRPFGHFDGYSSCPHCQQKAPSGEVANLVNRIASAVKKTGKHKSVLAWPYSAFTWSGSNDRAQIEFISQLSDDVNVLANFDTGSADLRNNAGVYLYDYNIKSIGPSETFKAQAQKSAEMGKKIYSKVESNDTPSVHYNAYIPVHFRWHQRFEEMAKTGVAGYLNQWAFYGPNGSLPEEMQYHSIWNPQKSAEVLLTCAIKRDFGIAQDKVQQVLEAWKLLSDSWDDFPYSAMTNGEREFYMRGPLHYGPSHPLIFNTQHRYWLSSRFYGLSGDLMALASPEELEKLLKDAKPRYVSELLMTLPYGIERYLELLDSCRRKWADGVAMLKQAIGEKPSARAQMELDVCETMEIHLATMENVIRFYDARDRLGRVKMSLQDFCNTMDELSGLLKAEIANAERILPILARDFRIATYDTEMVEEKIRQCKYVLEDELPIFSQTTRFHIWNDYP